MRYLEPKLPINTFSYIARDSKFNEEPWVDQVNAHVDAISHKVFVRSDELFNDLENLIRVQGEPFGGTSIYAQYRVFQAAREANITVMLDGQGADELLAGYYGYPGARLISLWEENRLLEMLRLISQWLKNTKTTPWLKCLSLAEDMVPEKLKGHGRKLTGKQAQPVWINKTFLKNIDVFCDYPKPMLMPRDSVIGRKLSETLRKKVCGHGLSHLLRFEDRNSMAHSVESRVPFLTIQLAETTLSMPESYLLSNDGQTKAIFRKAMRGIVPDAVLDRRDKIGFATPEQKWLQDQQKVVDDLLAKSVNLPIFIEGLCREEVNQLLDGRKPFTNTSWRLINYCSWAQLQ